MDELPMSNDVTADGVFELVRDGYDAIYEALEPGKTFARIWREKAYHGEFPIEFAHIGFLTTAEARQVLSYLRLTPASILADVACGAGGPGLWMAAQSGARLIGVDPAASGLVAARRRAAAVGLADRAEFRQGTFEHTCVETGGAHGLLSIEAFQYAPDKRAAVEEFHRVLRPGGRVAVVCFEVDPGKARGLPVLGVDPVVDYRPLFEEAEFVLDAYEETPGWQDRVYGAFQAIVEASDALIAELGQRAAASVLAEAMLTLSAMPHRRRVLAVASRP